MKNANRTAINAKPLVSYRVIYMGGIPAFPGILGRTTLSLYEHGFSLTSEKLKNQYFSYADVVSWLVIRERSSYAAANPSATFGPRHIRIEYVDEREQTQAILLEMFSSVFLPKQARDCQKLIALMKQHKIFDKFRPATPLPHADAGKPASFEAVELIEKLAALHQAGVLTDEEFQSKKAQLLEKL